MAIAIVIAVVPIVITMVSPVVIILDLVVVPIAHIEAGGVPMPVLLADRNSNATYSNINVFRDDNWFVADVQSTGKCRHRQKGNKKKAEHCILHDFILG